MSDPRFEVVAIEDLVIEGKSALASRELMSPYVWRHGDGFGLLLRAVPDEETPSGRIWFGRSDDGLRFAMDDAPLIVPSLPHLDSGGCEDPTVIEKHGVAYRCSRTEKNTKEATVLCRDDGAWFVFYEYSHDGRSCVGFAIGAAPGGLWEEHDDPVAARAGRWDDHHLSTGPLLEEPDDRVTMFYNGATQDARWAIGWAVFDIADEMTMVERCGEPLIAPPAADGDDREIAFANSVIEEGDLIRLYFSHNDKLPRRATLRRRGG